MRDNELIIWAEGWQKVKIPKSCLRKKHKNPGLAHSNDGDYAYCEKCGLRTPVVPHDNDAWAEAMLREAEANGTAFRDMEHLVFMHFKNIDTGEMNSHLVYRYDRAFPIDYSYTPCYGTHGNIGKVVGECPKCHQPIRTMDFTH